MTVPSPTSLQGLALALFVFAVAHTFSTRYFEHLANRHPNYAGVWHLLGEVEVVFGFWALVLVLATWARAGNGSAIQYLESRNFTELAFVFVIMLMAASRPVIDFAGAALSWIARLLPLKQPIA